MVRAINVNCTSSVFQGKLIRSCDAILPPCQAKLSGTVVGPKSGSGGADIKYSVRIHTYINARIYKSHKKIKHIQCCTLYTTKSVQQYAGETFIVRPRYTRLHYYEKGKLESISKISGQICVFHCLRCVCYASYLRARLISMEQKYFYMRGIFPCSFAQID